MLVLFVYKKSDVLVANSGLLYTFGDGRHGKLGLEEENFTNQFKPTLCPRFLDYHVHSVTCGGCHMLVLAKPRPEESEELILEEEDVTEDYFEKSYTELLGDTQSQTTLHRSYSAWVRRRERLSLFKRASTKGSQAEITTAGKPGADGPPQIQETRETESSSRGAQTTAFSRSHSATSNLLSHLVYNIF
ncbi:X-linked retinitis pigmentosa GTPase regulator-like [Carassius gibelio]|uniref:X-linked retinitis pigmentosa GTPase regulator-like n=1 Tax=Carassius gibelio TaxID=101364 RepID=UPI0022791CC3|nr:X-linked retinitis pigmentosa GTPase regulator-like [Carassius gibelio]